MKKILILLTNHDDLAGEKNGTYAPELTHALHEFKAGGYEYDLVSIQGGAAPIYGEEADDAVNQAVLADAEFRKRLADTLPVEKVDPADYAAVFYPGGFGLLFDLYTHEGTAEITAGLYEKGAVVGAVCHGPAGLLPVTLSDGKSILEGKTVTCFTREEEISFGTIDKIPYLLEEKMMEKAARFTKVQPWGDNVIVEDRLITGQNPASAGAVGKAMVERLK
ncbi:MAG: type 1 glutamine amidotransferase domain-containing protein [Acidobacteriota bacterium]|nr:type 1 glutamine amidotransferase domain-containing protein [Acidobacteriota bacterium]